ncbi:hypothetical protein HPP92_019883 [Vanilla planifolia]|uniref:Uncharacterized protein n=1 Tax=Vanilla planifolia TaxID=51239 RepID=A0A835Q9U9_VANPL|nr:hypothetical protein HPP92_019883 [Vanilla planifolia]
MVIPITTSVDHDTCEFNCLKTRIDLNCSSRVLVPLEHFKLPFLESSLLTNDAFGSRTSSFTEKNTKAELAASISNLVSKIKVRWQSGRNSSGELYIKDAVQAALQASVMDVLLPDPLTFGFRLTSRGSKAQTTGDPNEANLQCNDSSKQRSRASILAHEMTDMRVLIRNNTRDLIRMSFSVACRDVAGDNCIEWHNATVLWAGILSGICLEIPPLKEVAHQFSLYFLVPGEYTLVAAAIIDDANDVLLARARSDSQDEFIVCRGSPFRINVIGTV